MSEIIFAAPLQGYADAQWRKAHVEVYGAQGGAAMRYFTPFIRVEAGAIRARDMRDLEASLRDMPDRISAQIIFRNIDEFSMLTDAIVKTGCEYIDLNLGCPYPMQTRKGRGAAALENEALLAEVLEAMKARPNVKWSAKIRLGLADPEAWHKASHTLSAMPLEWLTVHPRVASQGYNGTLHDEQVGAIVETVGHPVIFNGELRTLADISEMRSRFPGVKGFMAGRGLLARPSLIAEYQSGQEWPQSRRLEYIRRMHDLMFNGYLATIEGGEHQVLSKMMAFWEYLEPELDHKQFKAIKKSKSLVRYQEALMN